MEWGIDWWTDNSASANQFVKNRIYILLQWGLDKMAAILQIAPKVWT